MSVTAPQGFEAAGVAAGIKSHRRARPRRSSSTAARRRRRPRCSRATAPRRTPSSGREQVIGDGVVAAIVLNSGGANCFTGRQGFQVTHRTAEAVGRALGVSAGDVLVCSTGLIGDQLDGEVLATGVSRRLAALGVRRRRRGRGPRHHDDRHRSRSRPSSSRATAGRSAAWPRAPACWRPGLATMLVVITTDAVLRAARRSTRRCARRRGSPSTGSTPTAACRRTTRSRSWRAAPSGVVPDARRVHRRRSPRSVATSPLQLQGDAEGASHDIAIEVRRCRHRGRRRRGRPLGRPQQPLQGRDLRQRPQLGSGARRDRHDGGRRSTRTTSTSR